MSWTVVPLSAAHTRTGFDCGKEPLNVFLHQRVSQYEKRGLGRTFVLEEAGQTRVLGYYTLAAAQLPLSVLPEDQAKKLPRHPVPVLLLGRLAVDRTLHGQGAGKFLLRDAVRRCVSVSDQIGAFAIYVEVIDDQAVRFYQKFSFRLLLPEPDKLFLKISDAHTAIGP
jgi:GNAT superfamily N-acetyltransferase